MKLSILQWKSYPSKPPSPSFSLSPTIPSLIPTFPSFKPFTIISATLQQEDTSKSEGEIVKLSGARERRKLGNESRESKAFDWKDDVEMKLIKKPKKRYASWTEELNLDHLARLGPQWWVVRVSRVGGQETAERLAKSLANNYPDIDFKLYIPAVQEKRKLKNGSYSIKSKSLFPGCVFLKCVLNKELHDFIRESDGIGGFVGSKVGNTKRQINKPRPVSEDDMEKIFIQAKEEQEKADLAFEEEQKSALDSGKPDLKNDSDLETLLGTSLRKGSKKGSDSSSKERKKKLLKVGSSVRVVSGSFAEFSGILKKVDKKNGTVTVGFTLFGKETIADLGINDIVEEVERA